MVAQAEDVEGKPHMTSVHIFVDNSNIFGGAQKAARRIEKVLSYHCVRIDYKRLFRILGHNRTDSNKGCSILAGSVPPANEALWGYAQRAGFDTKLLKRVEKDDGKLGEQSVDETIHLMIAQELLKSAVAKKMPGTIVLATGDGKRSEIGTSFREQVSLAADLGWGVEIWSWRDPLARALRDTRLKFPGLVEVHILDDWYWQVVFIEGGDYHYPGGRYQIDTRPCHSLDLTHEIFKT